jgi:hypothetical protein
LRAQARDNRGATGLFAAGQFGCNWWGWAIVRRQILQTSSPEGLALRQQLSCSGWRTAAILADTGQPSLDGRKLCLLLVAFPRRLKAYGCSALATLNPNASLLSLRSQKPTYAAALAQEWELNQLAGRLEELGSG